MSVDCFCIRGKFNFYVKAVDLENIVYKDSSDWMDDENYATPDEYVVKATPPGTGTATDFTVLVKHNNQLTFGGKLKDGIYCFEVDSCGKHYIRTVGLFPNIRCCIKQARAVLGNEFRSRIDEVESYLDSAAYNAELNNVKTAGKNLKIAEKLLENLKCDCSC